MDARFADVVAKLHPSFERLLAMKPVTCTTLPTNMPRSGIYLLSEGDKHLYVGRSKNIRGRLRAHSGAGAKENVAALAFLIARRATGHLIASYKPEGSRRALMQDERFRGAFEDAKARIREMDVRFVGEPHPESQAILEVYVAVALQTPYNDFDTH
jgi:hypothetical protein